MNGQQFVRLEPIRPARFAGALLVRPPEKKLYLCQTRSRQDETADWTVLAYEDRYIYVGAPYPTSRELHTPCVLDKNETGRVMLQIAYRVRFLGYDTVAFPAKKGRLSFATGGPELEDFHHQLETLSRYGYVCLSWPSDYQVTWREVPAEAPTLAELRPPEPTRAFAQKNLYVLPGHDQTCTKDVYVPPNLSETDVGDLLLQVLYKCGNPHWRNELWTRVCVHAGIVEEASASPALSGVAPRALAVRLGAGLRAVAAGESFRYCLPSPAASRPHKRQRLGNEAL